MRFAPTGVRILSYTSTTGASDVLHARIEALGAERVGRWRTQCVYYHPRHEGSGVDDLFTVHYGDQPQLLMSGDVIMAAGPEIVGVVEAMRTHTQRLKVTAEGSIHRCGDFVVRMGPLFLNETVSGRAHPTPRPSATQAQHCGWS